MSAAADLRRVARLVLNDYRAQFRLSALGPVWRMLFPFLESGALTLLVSVVFRVGGAPGDYLPFVFVGMLGWRIFARGIGAAVSAPVAYGALLKSSRVPLGIVISSAIAGTLLDGLLGLPALLLVLLVLEGPLQLTPATAWILVGAVLQVAFVWGLGMLLAVGVAFFRDIGIALGPGLRVLLFTMPVLYPITLLPIGWRGLVLSNPVSAAIECYRAALLGGAPVPPAALAAAAALAFATLLCGIWAMRRFEWAVREVI